MIYIQQTAEVKVHKMCTFLLNILFNIDDTDLRVPLFERALKTDVLDAVLDMKSIIVSIVLIDR